MDADEEQEISAASLADRIEAGEAIHILDVRNREESEAWPIDGPSVQITQVPHLKFVSAQVTGDAADLVDADTAYVAVCPRGEASAEAAATLRDAGVAVRNLAGGMEAWARVYREAVLPVDAAGLTAIQFRRPASGCLGYALIGDEEALVVDPLRAFTERYVEAVAAHDAEITAVLDTHLHADHVSGLRELAAETGARVLLSAEAADRGVTFDLDTVSDGAEFSVGGATVDVLGTPGHTTGSISLRVDDLLLTGDALFLDGAPRPDLEEGEAGARDHARTLHETLSERLADVSDDVLVGPGHVVPGRPLESNGSYTARLGALRERVAAFEESTDAFVERVLQSMGARPANFEQIIAVNAGRESIDASTAFEIELGPNNCAVQD